MSKGERVNLKIGFDKSQLTLFAIIFGVIAVGVLGYLAYDAYLKPVYTVDFNGEQLSFREDIKEAQKVEVIPGEAELRQQMVKLPVSSDSGSVVIRKGITNVTIVFMSTGSQENMGWYTVEVSEIIKKLTAFYRGQHGIDVKFAIAETENYEDLRGTNTAPIVALVHPDIADGTFVEVDSDRNVVTISGGDSLRDFDLATIKFLTTVLGIEI